MERFDTRIVGAEKPPTGATLAPTQYRDIHACMDPIAVVARQVQGEQPGPASSQAHPLLSNVLAYCIQYELFFLFINITYPEDQPHFYRNTLVNFIAVQTNTSLQTIR